MFGLGLNELLVLILIIVLLSWTGLWPAVIRGLRELRGERVEPPANTGYDNMDLCFKILGVSPSAPWEDVEKAYRVKAKIHHPDHGGDEDAMRALNDAYRQIKRSRGRG
jgi:hypothetical protein